MAIVSHCRHFDVVMIIVVSCLDCAMMMLLVSLFAQADVVDVDFTVCPG